MVLGTTSMEHYIDLLVIQLRLSSFRSCCFLWGYNHVLCLTAEAEDKYNLLNQSFPFETRVQALAAH
jgi:hypothetical protein